MRYVLSRKAMLEDGTPYSLAEIITRAACRGGFKPSSIRLRRLVNADPNP